MEAGKLRLTIRELLAIIVAIAAIGWAIAPKIWGAATWKDGVDQNLQQINRHLDEEDKRLDWLIQHNPDASQAPMSFKQTDTSSSVDLAVDNPRQDAQIPVNP